MTKTVTISLSLGSGAKAETLALRIKAWAAGRPISEVIRELILQELAIKDVPYPTQSKI